MMPSASQPRSSAWVSGEHPVVLHPETGERIDVEKPSIAEIARRHAPVAEAKVLGPEELVESLGIRVQSGELVVDGASDLVAYVIQAR